MECISDYTLVDPHVPRIDILKENTLRSKVFSSLYMVSGLIPRSLALAKRLILGAKL